MRVVLILLLALGCVGGVVIETPYLSLSSVGSELRVMDMAETVWLGMGAGADHPVDSHSDGNVVRLTVADVSCAADKDTVTCSLPPTGHLVASGRLYQNDTTMTLGSDVYRVTMTATLSGGEWGVGDVWNGESPGLVIRVYEQSPEERSERVGKGALVFLITVPFLLLAELVVVWVGF